MRVLVSCFADISGAGGGPTIALHTARGLRDRGHDVVLLSKVESGSSEGPGTVDGIPVVFHEASSGRAWRVPMLVREGILTRVLRERVSRPDAMVSISPFYVTAARRVWPQVRILYVFPCLLWRCLPFLRSNGAKGLLWRLDHWLVGRAERRALRDSDIIVVQGPSVVEDVLDFSPAARNRLKIAPTGVEDLQQQLTRSPGDIRQEHGTPEGATVLLGVGNIDRNKNYSALLEAFGELNDESLWLWIVGRGPELAGLQERARAMEAGRRVRFLGWRTDMPDVYAAADVLVHTAWYEAFGLVYLEAMICGRPVIGPKGEFPKVVSALDRIIESGKHGYLYSLSEAGDLERVLDYALANRARLPEMGQAARQLALREYSWDRYLDAVEMGIVKC